MRVTLSLDEVVELIDVAQRAVAWLPPLLESGVRKRLIRAIETLNTSLLAEQPDPEGWIPGPPPPFTAGEGMPEMEHRIGVVDGKEVAYYRVLGLKSRPMFCLSQEGANDEN